MSRLQSDPFEQKGDFEFNAANHCSDFLDYLVFFRLLRQAEKHRR